ncbi:hypothetical protein L211DRAFT_851587 [Terfezia boudieri ATCC MYA-4762]|uniref:DUF6589 domain-containing protein n=1 Tax=Terfezia boudieri ATCC MYA-4762 TaxID=1051890 RepID=A0A3N4LT85_9PEZI|nr:hypothetical protein L211DRAFT_851587 [Terfezia boudieri ATCC MYA-4762]
MSAKSQLDDPSQHPRFNPVLGRIERRGRPRKTAVPAEAEAAKQVPDDEEEEEVTSELDEKNARKLDECMDIIARNFMNMHGFLRCWDSTNSSARDKFLRNGGAAEMVQRWLPVARGLEGEMVKDTVVKICADEVKAIEQQRQCPLRYVQMDKRAESRVSLHGNIKSNLDEMREFLELHAPLSWSVLKALASGSTEKRNTDMSTLAAFANLLNGRNQKMNAFETILTVYLYSNGLNKAAVEVLHKLNMCSSYTHLNEVLHQLSDNLGQQLKEDVSSMPMRITIDNVNLSYGVRDATSINQAQLNNSTGGYITPLKGVLPGISKLLPWSWLNLGARVKLDPRELKASPEALRFMRSWNKWYICKLLKNHIMKLKGEEYSKPEVYQLQAEAPAIYTTELMDIPQDSIMGNHTSVRKVLTEVLKYSLQEVMDGLYLLGGNQLLADRIRSIQKLMEGDIPGEDFSSIIVLLGPLHTLMNIKKLIIRHYIGEMDGSVLGSLIAFNKSLKRERKIDSEAKDLWACMDLTKDSLDAVLLALAVEQGGKDNMTWDSFATGLSNGDINWRDMVEGFSEKLNYGYVANLRRRPEAERDRVLENILLFARQELEFRAFYTSMHHGDVGAMELILQLWGPQCLAGNQTKYGHELLDIRCGMLADWSEELKNIIRSNWVISP